jgi:hypothetical protein
MADGHEYPGPACEMIGIAVSQLLQLQAVEGVSARNFANELFLEFLPTGCAWSL